METTINQIQSELDTREQISEETLKELAERGGNKNEVFE